MSGEPVAPRHSLLADAQAIVFGTVLCALGVVTLQSAALTTGQAAGFALVASYATGHPFGAIFVAVSAPFYAFALWRIGWVFTLKSLFAVGLLAALTQVSPELLRLAPAHPAVAAALGGLCSGFGLLALFRHGASLGGVGVLAYWLQDATGFRAGWTQMLVDAGVFAFAFAVMPLEAVAWSIGGAALLNLVVGVNHRREWYVAR